MLYEKGRIGGAHSNYLYDSNFNTPSVNLHTIYVHSQAIESRPSCWACGFQLKILAVHPCRTAYLACVGGCQRTGGQREWSVCSLLWIWGRRLAMV